MCRPMPPLQVRQVWSCSKEQLVRRLGKVAGQNLWNHAHGRDDRPVEPPGKRKSVGAEVNWGIRFTCDADCTEVLEGIAAEVGRLWLCVCVVCAHLLLACSLCRHAECSSWWDREPEVQAERQATKVRPLCRQASMAVAVQLGSDLHHEATQQQLEASCIAYCFCALHTMLTPCWLSSRR